MYITGVCVMHVQVTVQSHVWTQAGKARVGQPLLAYVPEVDVEDKASVVLRLLVLRVKLLICCCCGRRLCCWLLHPCPAVAIMDGLPVARKDVIDGRMLSCVAADQRRSTLQPIEGSDHLK